ncbi:MAG: RDD family protein [Clostridium thermopalmarium]|nr:RDD family protein [Clostridium thermopalmarium]
MSNEEKNIVDVEFTAENEEITKEESVGNSDIISKVSFKDAFMSSILDILITGAISIAGLYIFDFILRIAAGYYVKEKVSVFLIIYLIVTLLYTTIMESSKSGNTIGKRAANLKTIKIK